MKIMKLFSMGLIVPVAATFLGLFFLSVTGTIEKAHAANDYPYPTSSSSEVDPWGFYKRNCTSFVAWRMNRDKGTTSSPYYFYNTMKGPNGVTGRFGNANNWDNNALALGFKVDNSPKKGDVAVWESYSGGAGSVGHVAYVESVNGDGSVNISEYNWNGGDKNYNTRSNVRADKYIHINNNTNVCDPPYYINACVKVNVPVNVRASNGSYLTAPNGGGTTVNANGTSFGLNEQFTLVKIDKYFAALKTRNGNYVSAEKGGGGTVSANRTAIAGWEVFKLFYNDFLFKADATTINNSEKFTMQALDGWGVNANSTNLGTWEKFKAIPNGSGKYYIQTFHGSYLQAKGGGGSTVSSASFNLGPWETFTLVDLGNNKVAIKTNDGVHYLQAANGGGSSMNALPGAIGSWETFTKVDRGDGSFSLKTVNGQYVIAGPGKMAMKTTFDSYVQAAGGGGSSVNNNGVAIGSYEKILMQGTGNGFTSVTLRAANGNYFAAEGGGGGAVNANRTIASIYETFTLNVHGINAFSFKTYNGRYLSAKQGYVSFKTYDNVHYVQAANGGGSTVNALPGAIGAWEKWKVSKY